MFVYMKNHNGFETIRRLTLKWLNVFLDFMIFEYSNEYFFFLKIKKHYYLDCIILISFYPVS